MRKPLTIKRLKELVSSERDPVVLARYKAILERKEERHAKRMEERRKAREADAQNDREAMAQVRVGDVFSAVWGWEQTNVNFFQVVGLVGKSSVRVREVYPAIIKEQEGVMCADRVYKMPENGEMLPHAKRSTFIKDCENGDVKRIFGGYHGKDEPPKPCFRISTYATASKEPGATASHYVSWYA